MPAATWRSASMSRPESVSSSTATSGSIIAICRTSLRFFSPPEKPSLRYRSWKRLSMPSRLVHSMRLRRTSSTEKSSMPLRRAIAWRKKLSTETPGISSGCWNPRNRPRRARSSVGRSVMSSPARQDAPGGHPVGRVGEQRVGEGRLARAVRAHQGVQRAGFDRQGHAAQDLVVVDRDVQVVDLEGGDVGRPDFASGRGAGGATPAL